MHVRIPETGEYVSPLDIDDPRALGSWGPAAVQHLDDAILLDREAGPGPDSRRDRIDEARVGQNQAARGGHPFCLPRDSAWVKRCGVRPAV
jgi:hypothetical protein